MYKNKNASYNKSDKSYRYSLNFQLQTYLCSVFCNILTIQIGTHLSVDPATFSGSSPQSKHQIMASKYLVTSCKESTCCFNLTSEKKLAVTETVPRTYSIPTGLVRTIEQKLLEILEDIDQKVTNNVYELNTVFQFLVVLTVQIIARIIEQRNTCKIEVQENVKG